MAVLQTLRNKAAGLLIGALGLALLAFILSDLFSSGNTFFSKYQDNAFSVDGDVVTTAEYDQRVEAMTVFQQVLTNQTSLDDATTLQIRENVYQTMVAEKMLKDQAARLGLAVTKEEMNSLITPENLSPILYRYPLFVDQETRQFNMQALTQFLTIVNQDPATLAPEQRFEQQRLLNIWLIVESEMKMYRLQEKYLSLLSNTFLATDVEAKAVYNDSKAVADMEYTLQNYSVVADSTVQVSDAEIRALYDRRKENYFLTSNLSKISYFVKDVIPSTEDYDAVKKEIDVAYEKLKSSADPALVVNEYSSEQYIDAFLSFADLNPNMKTFMEESNVGEVSEPYVNGQFYVTYKLVDRILAADSVKLQAITIPQGLVAEAATHLVDSLYSVVKGGKSFAEVADEMYPGGNGGTIGWFREVDLLESGIAKECFAAAKGDILKLQLMGQTQLFRIEDKTMPVTKVKVAVVSMPVIISDKTHNIIDNELNQFITANGTIENFNDAAENSGYSLVADQLISPSDMTLPSSVRGSREVVRWAFNENVGSAKKFDIGTQRVVAIIKDKIDGEYMPLAQISPVLKAELIRDKKAEVMIADLKSKNLASVAAYAEALGAPVDTARFVTFETETMDFGYEPMFNAYAKNGQLDKLEGPLKGNAGVYLLNVISKTEDQKEYNAEEAKETISQQNRYYVMSQTMYVLQEKLNVKDNRVKFW